MLLPSGEVELGIHLSDQSSGGEVEAASDAHLPLIPGLGGRGKWNSVSCRPPVVTQ